MIIFKINGTLMKKVYKVYDKIFDWFDQHRNKDLQEYQDLLTASSFNVLVHKIEDPECGDATIWISQKQKK